MNKDYGLSGLAIDVGACLNIKLTKHFWLIGKVAYSPIKYDSDKTIYGKNWAENQY